MTWAIIHAQKVIRMMDAVTGKFFQTASILEGYHYRKGIKQLLWQQGFTYINT
jgi:hypothetical protein